MSATDIDIHMMELALAQAKQAGELGEVPVGAVLSINDKLVASGRNQSISLIDPSAHAEMQVIRKAAQIIGNYRLINATLYVTLEPCSMCAGLLVHSRINRLVFGAKDPKAGACGSISNIINDSRLNHQIEMTSGVLERECSALLTDFFKIRREQKKKLKQRRTNLE
ncbi:tRNA adenosine(34) deaminase TadA [Ningiella sp. W23]|uniref:tRNA adenosine(34) deaminase TadA n=1 Tax=Ningiella sp. W23 TaxID=3023715 RepID=UPI0037570AE1